MAKISMTQTVEDALNVLAPELGCKKIENVHRLSGGASQETWSFRGITESGSSEKYILRRSPGGNRPAEPDHKLSLEDEASLITAALDAGVIAPKIKHVCQVGDGIENGFIMEHVEGETIARKILRDNKFIDARLALTAQCAISLAKIHSVKLSKMPTDIPVSTGMDELKKYEGIYRDFDAPRPVFELAIQWLTSNAPSLDNPVLVHGDFRLGNLMVDTAGLAAILDWELAHLGDPREDIGWICVNSWRFGQREKRVGGFGDLEDFLAAYANAGGQAYTLEEINWWEMLGSLKWGIMCMIMYEAFRTGADASVERAAIGRRVSECEIDLINLIEMAS